MRKNHNFILPETKEQPKTSLGSQAGFAPLETPERLTGSLRSLMGFTLFELLIVSCTLSIVMLAVYSSFISGMRLWQRCRTSDLRETRIIMGLEKFSSQLRQGLDFPAIGYSGTRNKFSFPLVEAGEITTAAFEFDPERKLLIRKKKKFEYAPVQAKEASRDFIPLVDDVEFSYCYFDSGAEQKYPWKEEWKPEDGVPLAVKITIKFKSGTIDKTKSATVYFPIA